MADKKESMGAFAKASLISTATVTRMDSSGHTRPHYKLVAMEVLLCGLHRLSALTVWRAWLLLAPGIQGISRNWIGGLGV